MLDARIAPGFAIESSLENISFLTLILRSSFFVKPLFSATRSVSNFFNFLIEFEDLIHSVINV